MKRIRYNNKRKRNKGKFKKGFYIPINEEKYKQPTDKTMNKYQYPEYRSSWELFYMKMLDNSDKVEYWGTESFHIPYFDSVKMKWRRYFPDFFIKLTDGTKLIHEIKPSSQQKQQLNIDKWQAAENYCKQKGIIFQVITEKHLQQWGMKLK